ncbi:WD40 repeat-containing protein [Handroanthus impetiginosus]|uniref:WD40 repeat-containing protein n=1 Tax=Handroanthus impetiginosus TaxID=429701 RepID=A0A2G9I9H9_9LAMI|nr:WD40 repeat-containing protein [Handroanthus impetiginosus]
MFPSDQPCTSSTHSSSPPSPPYPQKPTSLNPHSTFLTTNHQCIATFKSQNSYTSSLILMGDFLFTGSSNKEIRLLKRSTLTPPPDDQNPTLVLAGKGAVKALVALPNKLISAHQDHKIRVWKINQIDFHIISHLATLPTLSDRALKLLIPKNHIQIRRHKKCTWVHHNDTVSALALSRDESKLYSVSWDRTLKIWNTTDFKCIESVNNAHDDAINAIVLSENGHVYTGSSDKKIKVWKQSLGQKKHSLVATLEKHKSGINALAVRTNENQEMVLYSGSYDKSILVWMINEGEMEVVEALKGHTKSILCLAVTSEFLCSGSADKTVRIWRGVGKSYSCLAVLEGHKGPIKCIAVGFDHTEKNASEGLSNCVLYSASLDCDIKVWKIFLPLP